MAVIGLDIGTTQVKCGVYGADGKVLGGCAVEYAICFEGGYQYADARAMWENVKTVLKRAAAVAAVEAVCVTSFGESFVPVTKDFQILENSMLYTDPRGTEEAAELRERITDEEAFGICGNVPHSMYALPKIMWLEKNQPQVYKKADYLLPIASFIMYMLSGEAVTDYSLAARTMLLDIAEKKWSDRLLKISGADGRKLPRPVLSGTVAGLLRKNVAEELGLSPACKVIAGAHDQVASALGAGVLAPGSSVDGIGTVECITPVFDRQLKDANAMQSGFSCIPYVLEGMYTTYMFNYSGGALIKWFRDKVVPENTAALKASGSSFYDYYAGRMPRDPTGLLVLPHFNGAATPYMDLGARGAILNLDINTGAADIYKGIMEGCSYEMRLNLDYGARSGIRVKELTLTGGGANSGEWLQIKADIMDMPVYPLAGADAGIAGCAMLALAATGGVKDLKEAAALLVKKREPYLPDRERAEKYSAIYEKYKKIYQLVKEIR